MLQVKTILNNTYKFKSFVYGDIKFDEKAKTVYVNIKPRKNSKPVCSKCGRKGNVYDTSPDPRKFKFLPLFLCIPIVFVYFMRRVNCQHCGVKVEKVPWAVSKKSHLTQAYMRHLASWAEVLPWQTVAERFQVSWKQVADSVTHVVEWGLKRRVLTGIKAIGVDEIAWKKGHKYLTLVYEISKDSVRLLYIAKGRSEEAFSGFFKEIGPESCREIAYVCSDMWKPYRKVIQQCIPQAIHILDRFPIIHTHLTCV